MLKKSLFIFLLVSPLYVWADECPAVSKKMGTAIEEQVQKERGIETCKYRYVYKEMGVELVLFSITGSCLENMELPAGSCGNKNTIFVAGVISGKVQPPVVVSDTVFSPIKVKKVEGEIVLTGLSYSKTDPLCCPSVKENRNMKITETGFQK